MTIQGEEMGLKGLVIAVPRETIPGERRVAVIPETVEKLRAAGAAVLVESGAGEGAWLGDDRFRAAGAEIVPGDRELYRRANLILKVKEPCFNEKTGRHEADLYPEESVLACFLHPANPANHQAVRKLAARRITAFTLDGVPRISRAQQMDALTAMSTIAGYKAAIIAAFRLPRIIPMMPTASGILPPAVFLVVGTGVAGLQAIAAAKRLGAKVMTLDIRPEANEQARSVGAEVIPFPVPPEEAVGEGGYARRLSGEWLARERAALASFAEKSDAVILTALVPGEEAPVLVDEAAVGRMKEGSVIIDIAIDQGGNCRLSRPGVEYERDGVFISALRNIPAGVSIDATFLFARSLFNFVEHLAAADAIAGDSADEIARAALVTRNGRIVHRGTLLAMGEEGQPA